ncbi:MAG: hypothetical protein IJS52_07025 [Bacilli bacterium]|nr:hypothetical protein [Bacilli bacterium]
MKIKRIKWKDRMLDNDIKYGGFLSYRHLRIIAWFCLAIAQVSVILQLEAKLAPDTVRTVETWNNVISVFASLPIPLFLLANISTILHQRGAYKGLFIRYGVLAGGMYILANFVVFHFGFRTLLALDPEANWGTAAMFFGALLPALGKSGYVLNIFIDMLLIVLMFYFMNYVPNAKIFQGKRIILFRLMFILPVAYEVAGIVIKYMIGMGNFSIPSPVFFLLPSKPPLVLAAFITFIFALKISEIAFIRRHNNSKEAFEEHRQTKAHSLKISINLSIVFAIFATIDLILVIVLAITTAAGYIMQYPDITDAELELLVFYKLNVFEGIGVGGAIGLFIAIPLVLLFSYTKKHKNPNVDLLVPVAGILLIVIVLLEGTFQVVTLNMANFMQKMREALVEEEEGGGGTALALEIARLTSFVRNVRL